MSRFVGRVAFALFASLVIAGCGVGAITAEGEAPKAPAAPAPTTFKVRLENVAAFQQLKSGVFNTRVGGIAPGALAPGDAYEIAFTAGRGQRVAFASMLGASNDWVFATDPEGIALHENGIPISGDVTSRVYLYDVGSEVDEEPAVGAHTGPRQSTSIDGPGAPDPIKRVRRVPAAAPLTAGGTFMVPPVASMIRVTLTPRGTEFRLRIENVANDTSTLMTSEGPKPVRISPGVWALTAGGQPLFTDGSPDRAQGLEDIAESGNPAALIASLLPTTGLATGLSPGVAVVHKGRAPLLGLGEKDRGLGLERIAEDGMADPLGAALKSSGDASLSKVAVFDTPVGRENPSGIGPGRAFEVQVQAVPGDRLSLATMFGWSNDWFFATVEEGVPLFDVTGAPLDGPITSSMRLYDSGTELSEEPGVGPNTGPQQSGPNTGVLDTDSRVREVTSAQYSTPVSHHLRLTITPVKPAEQMQ